MWGFVEGPLQLQTSKLDITNSDNDSAVIGNTDFNTDSCENDKQLPIVEHVRPARNSKSPDIFVASIDWL